jgi:pyruvate formate lyase activating enzyme
MTTQETSIIGRILHLQRFSTEDGPGIRTTVFFKGCPLHCAWCHNPESNSPYVQVQWVESRCIGCDSCLSACLLGTLTRTEEGVVIDRDECIACSECVAVCPAGALEQLGVAAEVDALAAELIKDHAYYQASSGGVTLSGGEPTMQPDFAAGLLQKLKAAGLHTALDTCGLCNRTAFESMLPYVDLVLYDVKLFDPELHRQYTGQDNIRILDNLRWLGKYIAEHGAPRLWIRTPLIPGATASAENVSSIGRWLAVELGELVERWELCAFNNLCRDKYRRLGLEWAYASTPLIPQAELDALQTLARSCELPPERVAVTGAARFDPESN